MLTVTENAQAVVKGLTEGSPQPTAGLRIALDQDEIAVAVVPAPQPTDVVVEAGEARVYVAQDTAPSLEGRILDAAQTEQGIGFTLAETA
jgi:Fe-S cluster assembly iron-binding protein IscA